MWVGNVICTWDVRLDPVAVPRIDPYVTVKSALFGRQTPALHSMLFALHGCFCFIRNALSALILLLRLRKKERSSLLHNMAATRWLLPACNRRLTQAAELPSRLACFFADHGCPHCVRTTNAVITVMLRLRKHTS